MTTADSNFLDFAMLNGKVMPAAALKVSPLGAGFMFGEGFFESVRVEDSQVRFFDAHYARLAISLGYFDAEPIAPRTDLENRCAAVIDANSLVSGSLKIVVFKDVAGWGELIVARPAAYPASRYETGFALKTVPGDLRVDPLHALKSLNYLANIRAKRIALDDGFDEALLIDPQRRVLEGATTTVFMVKDQVVSTPSLHSGILPGVMRACVIQLLASQGVRECDIDIAELREADEVFVTNALLGVMPVARVDAASYDFANNNVTRSLMESLRA